MGQGHDIGQGQKGMIGGQGLGREHVQARGADAARLQRRQQRLLIHHAAAGCVDEDGAGFHAGQRGRVDEMMGGGRVGAVQADEIAGLQQFVQSHQLCARLGRVGAGMTVVVEQTRVEAAQPPGHGRADAAQAHDAHRSAVQVGPDPAHGRPGLPAARFHIFRRFYHAAGRSQHQPDGEIGHGVGEDAGRVAHGDAAGGAGGQIDVIHAHRHLTDDLELRAGRVQQAGVDAVGEQGDEAIDASDAAQKVIVGGRAGLGPHIQSQMTGGQLLHGRFGQRASDENAVHGYQTSQCTTCFSTRLRPLRGGRCSARGSAG